MAAKFLGEQARTLLPERFLRLPNARRHAGLAGQTEDIGILTGTQPGLTAAIAVL
jgi:hypothetical protein